VGGGEMVEYVDEVGQEGEREACADEVLDVTKMTSS
jgi:hypothetical protein